MSRAVRQRKSLDRETSLPPLDKGGAIAAVISLLQPRAGHKRTFEEVALRQRYEFHLGEEVHRLRETFPSSINNLVVFLGLLGMLDGVLPILEVRSRVVSCLIVCLIFCLCYFYLENWKSNVLSLTENHASSAELL